MHIASCYRDFIQGAAISPTKAHKIGTRKQGDMEFSLRKRDGFRASLFQNPPQISPLLP